MLVRSLLSHAASCPLLIIALMQPPNEWPQARLLQGKELLARKHPFLKSNWALFPAI
jgi:hypothetical protein